MAALDWEMIDLGPLEEPELWDLLVAVQVAVIKSPITFGVNQKN